MIKIEDKDLPGLYQTSDTASIKEQRKFFNGITWYLILLIIAAIFAYFADDYPNPILKIISTILFLLTLFIMIWLRISRPDDIWYNGRAVAESVKTRSWRWMMRAEPYVDCENVEIMRKHFINDMKTILKQNETLISKLGISASIEDPISVIMIQVRKLNLTERFEFYRKERITNQALWYTKKAKFNKNKAELWFWTTVSLHALAIILLLYNIYEPTLKMPIEVIAVAASSVLTWLQSKKHNELSSSYSLTAHEIVLIKSEITRIETESDFSNYIMNCENAFSREHTQWFARKNE
ncbi:MAG: DUF4231 domain-containing protein [Flavobacterium sp.]|uniref:DUF4231 domain-containing protein n=1 Tax=Flavobacterium sp. TaxID=239 RepID=UPI0027351DB7|nr:DUF4231 domain-containing protein [Flavobacterium sp.]MDP3679402.1 DUF4231 domain-containing protein [Flavobacterium sp.]